MTTTSKRTTTTTPTTTKPRTGRGAIAAVPPLTILTPRLAEQARAARDGLQAFELTATSPGTWARVRMVDLSDSDQLVALPADVLRDVLQAHEDARAYVGQPVTLEGGGLNIERVVALGKGDQLIRDAYCLAGFVDPPLIRHESARIAPAQIVVDAIHPADRQRFFDLCQGARPDAGPDSTGDIEGVADEPVDRDAAA